MLYRSWYHHRFDNQFSFYHVARKVQNTPVNLKLMIHFAAKFCWPRMAAVVKQIILGCQSCTQNASKYCNKHHLQMFLADKPLDSVAINILGSFLKTTQDVQYIVIFSTFCSKLRRAISTIKKTSTHVANLVFNHLIVMYSMQSNVFLDNGIQFISKLFATMCALHVARYPTTKVYHSPTNG